MRRLALVVLLVFAVPAGAADSDAMKRAAEAEKARRAKIGTPAPVYTNVTGSALGAMMGPPRPAASPAPVTAEAASASEPTPEPAKEAKEETAASTDEAAVTAEPVHDEAYWRERMNEAKKRIVELEKDLVWAKQKLVVVQSDLIVPYDPKREFDRKIENDSVLAEKSRVEAELAKARAEPARIKEEGRKEGAPPGWFR